MPSKLREPKHDITYLNCNLIIIIYLHYSRTNNTVCVNNILYLYFDHIIYYIFIRSTRTHWWQLQPPSGRFIQKCLLQVDDETKELTVVDMGTTLPTTQPFLGLDLPPFFFLGVVGWVTWLGPTHRMVWWCLVSCCFFWGRCVDNFCKYSNFLSFGWDYRDCKSPRLAFLRSHDCSWKFHITSWWFPRGYVKYQTYSISIWSSVITHRVNWTLQFFPSHQMVL